jgi:hypothetical protein
VCRSTRAGRDASPIADEVITHLAGLVGANVKAMLGFKAEVPDNVVCTVTEYNRTLSTTGASLAIR